MAKEVVKNRLVEVFQVKGEQRLHLQRGSRRQRLKALMAQISLHIARDISEWAARP